ncbi:hypothetical protein ACW7EJ_16845, partial [Acinetobacter soli]
MPSVIKFPNAVSFLRGKVIAHQGKLIDIKGYAADPTAVSLLAPFANEIESIRNAEIGATTTAAFDNPRDAGDVNKPSVRKNETALGNLITDGMLDRAKQVDGEVVAASTYWPFRRTCAFTIRLFTAFELS